MIGCLQARSLSLGSQPGPSQSMGSAKYRDIRKGPSGIDLHVRSQTHEK